MKLKEIGGCIIGVFELVGFFIALSYPILLLFLWAADHR